MSRLGFALLCAGFLAGCSSEEQPPPTSCTAVCARFTACGVNQAGCAGACAAWSEVQRGCVVNAAGCPEVTACVQAPVLDGGATTDGTTPAVDGGTSANCDPPKIVASGQLCNGQGTIQKCCVGSIDDATVSNPGALCAYLSELVCTGMGGCTAVCPSSDKYAPENTLAASPCRLRCATLADCGGGRYTACRKPTGQGATDATMCF